MSEQNPSRRQKAASSIQADDNVYGAVQGAEKVEQNFYIFERDVSTPQEAWNTVHRASQIEFAIEVGDVVTFSADVLVLKFAEYLYGADRAVAEVLR